MEADMTVDGLRTPPWPHYPHCPSCHCRVVSEDPVATKRASGRTVADAATFVGTECPDCHADLGGVEK